MTTQGWNMAFFWLGVALIALKWLGFPGIGTMAWGWVLAPFGVAAAWWAFADATGVTQRQIMARMQRQASERRRAQYERLGMRIGRDMPLRGQRATDAPKPGERSG